MIKTAKSKIISKIKKCLRLAADAGATEHEAAAALRQAQKLMAEHAIDDNDLLAAEASAEYSKASARVKPARWEVLLANYCGRVFGVSFIFRREFLCSSWVFIGTGPNPLIAKYAFDVLLRQCKNARKAYIDNHLGRCKPATRTKRADSFCEAWVYAAAGKLPKLTRTEEQDRAIAAHLAVLGWEIKQSAATDRNKGKRDDRDLIHGLKSGAEAILNNGVGAGPAGPQAIGLEGGKA